MATLDQIDTIVVVMMENRSFDHMLGYLSHPDYGKRDDVEGLKDDLTRFTNVCGAVRQAPFRATRLDMTDDPKHERDNFRIQMGADVKPTVPYPMNGFMRNYALDEGLSAEASREVMGFFTPEEIPITAFLANNFVVCDNWFAPIPTSTQPNRLMAMGGYTKTDNTFHNTVPDQDLVYAWCRRRGIHWRVYHQGWPFFMVMNQWRLEILTDHDHFFPLCHLAEDFAAPMAFPQVVFVEPKYTSDHFSLPIPSDDHAPSSVSGGQVFLREVYEALRANPQRWQRTVMIVSYDEAGGFFDHVSPPELETQVIDGTAAPFKTMGVRVPALIVSPLVKAKGVFSGLLDHTSILRFIGEKFGDQGYYSNEVNSRPKVGSVAAVLSDAKCRVDAARLDTPPTPPYTQKDSFVRGRSYRPVTPDAEAFGYALTHILSDEHERGWATQKFPELAQLMTARANLLEQLARSMLHAKGCKIAPDCESVFKVFLDEQQRQLDQHTALAGVAYANLASMVHRMVAEAQISAANNEITKPNFETTKRDSLFYRAA